MSAFQELNVTPAGLKVLLLAFIPQNLPVLITGPAGVGKSEIVDQVARELDYDLVISHPVVEDPTDAKGLPFPAADGKSARFLPFGNLDTILRATTPTLWFLDDFGQGSPAVQAAYMQILLARRVGEHVIPDCVTIVAATNRRTDNAGVSYILDPVLSRFATIVNVKPCIHSWAAWATDQGVNQILIQFLRFRPDLLIQEKKNRDIVGSPSPRSWRFLDKTMQYLHPELELVSFAGTVGRQAASEFMAFKQVYRELVGFDQILMHPHSAPLPDPDKLSVLFALCAMLSTNASVSNFDALLIYVNRLIKAGFREHAAFFITDATKRKPDLLQTDSFVREMEVGELGQIVRGPTEIKLAA